MLGISQLQARGDAAVHVRTNNSFPPASSSVAGAQVRAHGCQGKFFVPQTSTVVTAAAHTVTFRLQMTSCATRLIRATRAHVVRDIAAAV
jgi:hypothetical protein